MTDTIDAPEVNITAVTTTTTGVAGRTLNKARHNHFVIDSPKNPGEATSTAEAFFAGVAACGVTLVQGEAGREDIPLEHLEVSITAYKLVDGPPDFDRMEVVFTYTGPTMEQANMLTNVWKGRCPLYRAISGSIPHTIEVRIAENVTAS